MWLYHADALGGTMKKRIISALITVCACAGVFAGDAAVFVDSGFSSDGKVYVFGQYGKTDKSFQGWADLFAVDVEKNNYIPGECFSIKPSVETKNKKGKDLYGELAGKSFFEHKKYDLKKATPDKVVYIRESEQKSGTEEIVFKDFVSSVSKDQGYYHVKLVPEISGTGVNVKSSFFIMLSKEDSDGKVLARQKIGSPSVVRKGVNNYKIERIVCSADGKSIVFVVEKTCEDSTGTNIRYMIEAARLNDDFFTNLAPKETVAPVQTTEVVIETAVTPGESAAVPHTVIVSDSEDDKAIEFYSSEGDAK